MAIQPIKQAQDTQEPRGVLGFISELANTYKEGKDKKTFENLLSEYQQNIEDENAFENLQINLMKADVSPSRQLEYQRKINEMGEMVAKKQKAFTDKVEAKAKLEKEKNEAERNKVKEENRRKETKEILKLGGASEEEAEVKSEFYTPESARFEAGKKLAVKPGSTIIKGTKGQEKRREETEENGLKARKLLIEAPNLKQAIQNLGKEGRGKIAMAASYIPGVGNKIAESVWGENEQTINSIVKESLLKSGDLTGLRLTDYKLRYLEGAMPSPYKTQAANEAAYDIWERSQELKVKLQEVQNEFLKELEEQGAKTLPADYDLQLQDRLDKAGLNKELDKLVDDAKKAPENSAAAKQTGLKSMPPASEAKGRTIKNDETGQMYKSNGKTWEPV